MIYIDDTPQEQDGDFNQSFNKSFRSKRSGESYIFIPKTYNNTEN